jgi:hypothetical protein
MVQESFSDNFPVAPGLVEAHDVTGFEARNRRARTYGWLLPIVAPLLSAATVVVSENSHFIDAVGKAIAYQVPEDGDIAPENTGCPPTKPELQLLFVNPSRSNLFAAVDTAVRDVSAQNSATHTFPVSVPEGFIKSERLFWPGENYFDTNLQNFTTSFGAKIEVNGSHEGKKFSLNPVGFERMVADIFNRSGLYDTQGIDQLVECRAQRIFEDGEYKDKTISVNILPDGDKAFEGNNVVTFAEGHNIGSHSIGLGVSDIPITLFGVKITPDSEILVAGGNGDLKDNQNIVNKRLLHELLHVLLFDDLSRTAQELDEQERTVSYIVDKLTAYYLANQNLPAVVTIG